MINRQLEIIYILMNKGTVKAQELAAHFEVSPRTIYRDVESLSMAGIPIYAGRGKGGGIRLMEQFVLDKLLLSAEEQRKILAALASLREIGASGEERILEKLETFFRTETRDWVSIDFSDWSGRRGELFGQIKDAILNRRVLEFDYYGRDGDMSHRQAEPVQLLFKEYTWYLRAWCRGRKAMRLFKVLRMKRVEVLEEIFETGARHREEERDKAKEEMPKPETETAKKPREMPKTETTREPEGIPETETAREPGEMPKTAVAADKWWDEITLRVDRKEAYRVYDRFEEEEITVLPQGDFEIRFCCLVDDWVYGLILSFGPSARVLGPDRVRRELAERIRRMAQMYG